MIVAIALGFVAIFVLSYWASARVAAKRQSTGLAVVAGVISYLLMLGGYLTALTFWARAQLMIFLNDELPLLVEKVVYLVDRLTLIRDTI